MTLIRFDKAFLASDMAVRAEMEEKAAWKKVEEAETFEEARKLELVTGEAVKKAKEARAKEKKEWGSVWAEGELWEVARVATWEAAKVAMCHGLM